MVAVRIASDGWEAPGTSMYGYARDVLAAVRLAGVDAIGSSIANVTDGRRFGGTIGPVLRCFLGRFENPDGRLVHYTGWPPNGRKGARVFNIYDLFAFHDTGPAALLRRAAYRAMARRADAIVCDSPFIAREVGQLLGSRTGEKTEVIPIPFAEPPDQPRPPFVTDVLWVGAESPRKGLAFFLRESKKFPDLSVTVRWSPMRRAGPGPDTLSAMAASTRANLTHVSGRLDDAEMDRMFRSARCVVSTSTYEGFHMPIMEAYLRGVPIVVPDAPLYRDIYGASAGTFYYERTPGGAHDLTTAVREAVQGAGFVPDPRIREWVSLQHVGAALKAVYERVAEMPDRRGDA